jgi:hypothetical protein
MSDDKFIKGSDLSPAGNTNQGHLMLRLRSPIDGRLLACSSDFARQ